MAKQKQNNSKSSPDLRIEESKQVQLRQSQERYHRTIMDNDITICHGPAGTSKTFTAVYTALTLLATKEVDQIILTKPIQESGEKLGFLPCTVEEKIDPFMQSFMDNAKKIIGPESTGWLMTQNKIIYEPLAYMRGRTFDNAMMLLDEAQNSDFRQLMLFVTRMGKGSKIVLSGDVGQYDIKKSQVALPKFADMITKVKGVGVHVFTENDIVRSKILIDVVKQYQKYKEENGE